jgi:hypothetical protein
MMSVKVKLRSRSREEGKLVATMELHMPIEKQGGWLVGCDNWAPQKKAPQKKAPQKKATGLAWPSKHGG